MLQRNKSIRLQTRRRPSNLNLKHATAAQRAEALEERCSDDDSSQSSSAAPPVFASVHRTRHAGISAIKRDGIPTTTLMNTHGQQQQRPSYQQYQQQRRLQQQQQQFLQHQTQQQLDNANNTVMHKFVKNERNWYDATERQQQQSQHQQQQLHLSTSTSIGAATAVAAAFDVKQLIAVPIPQLPLRQMNQGIEQQQQSLPPTKISRIPMMQQQQPNFNQISKTATNLLNDIYEKHLLSQTTFHENSSNNIQFQHQHQQQQQRAMQHSQPNAGLQLTGVGDFNLNNYASNLAHMQQQQQQQQQQQHTYQQHFQHSHHNNEQQQLQQHMLRQQKPIHFLKLPPPPPVTTTTAVAKTHFQFLQQQQQQQMLQSTEMPPPPAPLNHVYETIAERPPIPPPPPEKQTNCSENCETVAVAEISPTPPPLPPSRQLRKRLTAAAAISSRTQKLNNKKIVATPGDSNMQRKPAIDKIADENPKMTALNPPAYVPPPIATAGNIQQHQQQHAHKRQQQQYNTQQRTKADGEHKNYIYQQLREHQQQQRQHQHNKVYQHKQQQQQNMRAVPLGGNAVVPIANIPSGNTIQHQATIHVSAVAVAPTPIVDVNNLTVEEQLQQAGLLQNSSSSNNNGNNMHHNNRAIHCSALPIVFEEEQLTPTSAADVDVGVEFNAAFVLQHEAAVADIIGGGIAAAEAGMTAKLPYRHGKIEVSLETAQAMAAAAYYARAAQKLAQSGSTRNRATDMTNSNSNSSTVTTRNGGFCGALQRAPPPMPPGLARRLANKENYGIGKVKVMLRVADTHSDTATTADGSTTPAHFMALDKKKRQVTLTDPTAAANTAAAASTSQERGPMVAAPKMFAFDSLFTADDQQSDICASALSEVIPAVLEGSDGCLLTIGYPSSGQAKTMLGNVNPPNELGAIPCAISWLYKGINERRQKSGARFSVRVSALGVSATKPDSSSKDLLAAHATESDDSPGVYLRDDFLGGPTELRAPTAERAALFLDAALAGRPQGGLEPAMIFTLHVYQYSLSRKGGVAGGRSRLHLIDLGGCANRSGGLPLSGIGNILLAILSGQRHPPNKDHPLTPLLKDCLAPLTCHVAIMAHVVHTQSHTDALTTIQLASRIHRLRRRKHRFPLQADKTAAGLAAGINGGHQSTGSSAGSGADPSSSELSADTVIYMGPSDDATDGEHPPVYLPSLSSGDNRGVMSKALKGSGIEKQQTQTKIPSAAKKMAAQKAPQSPVITSRTGSLKRGHANSPTPQQQQQPAGEQQQAYFSPSHSLKTIPHSASSPKIIAGNLRHPGMSMMCSKGSNVPSPKGSPLRRPGVGVTAVGEQQLASAAECPNSPMRKITEEQWIDGPRVSRAKVAEARHLLREVNHVKQCETWIDGPKSQSSRSLTAGNLPTNAQHAQTYGFMDSHKKTMIRQWVENQTSQVFQSSSAACSPTHHSRAAVEQQAQHIRSITYHMAQLKQKSLDACGQNEDFYAQQQTQQHMHSAATDQHSLRSSQLELVNPLGAGLTTAYSTTNASAPAEIRGANYRAPSGNPTIQRDETDLCSERSHHAGYGTISGGGTALVAIDGNGGHQQTDGDEDQDSGPSEVPPALPLIEPLGSREISHESLHRILSRHVSRESLYQQQQQQQELRRQEDFQQQHQQQQLQRQSSHHYSQHSMGMSDCGLQVTEEEIARTMGSEHPLAALSHCDNMSIVSSFNMAGDAFSDCAMGERTRNQFDQLARLREIFTSQLAMAEVTPVFRSGCDVGSVYSEPAYRFNTGPGSVCSEPPYRPPSPRLPSRSPSQGSLPSLNGIMQIAGMEQYASLRHPDGASDPNLPKLEKPCMLEHVEINEVDEKSALLSPSKRPLLEHDTPKHLNTSTHALPITTQTQLPLLPLNTSSEAYDSGHDSSTPRTSKHSGISRRAESGYHSVATARDSDESSFTSGVSKEQTHRITTIVKTKTKRQDKGLCTWLMNPFTCTYPETEGEVSDF